MIHPWEVRSGYSPSFQSNGNEQPRYRGVHVSAGGFGGTACTVAGGQRFRCGGSNGGGGGGDRARHVRNRRRGVRHSLRSEDGQGARADVDGGCAKGSHTRFLPLQGLPTHAFRRSAGGFASRGGRGVPVPCRQPVHPAAGDVAGTGHRVR